MRYKIYCDNCKTNHKVDFSNDLFGECVEAIHSDIRSLSEYLFRANVHVAPVTEGAEVIIRPIIERMIRCCEDPDVRIELIYDDE